MMREKEVLAVSLSLTFLLMLLPLFSCTPSFLKSKITDPLPSFLCNSHLDSMTLPLFDFPLSRQSVSLLLFTIHFPAISFSRIMRGSNNISQYNENHTTFPLAVIHVSSSGCRKGANGRDENTNRLRCVHQVVEWTPCQSIQMREGELHILV